MVLSIQAVNFRPMATAWHNALLVSCHDSLSVPGHNHSLTVNICSCLSSALKLSSDNQMFLLQTMMSVTLLLESCTTNLEKQNF